MSDRSLAPRLAALACALMPLLGWAASEPEFDEVVLSDNSGEAGRIRVGGALFVGQRYLGSDERRIALLPVVNWQSGSGWFAGTGNGVGYNFSKERGTSFGVRLGIDYGRKESRSSALAGMGDISPSPQVGVFFNKRLVQGFGLATTLRASSHGTLADIGLNWSTPLAAATFLKLGAAATLADGRYMRTYFGVDADQSARSGYAVYDARAGVRDTRASVGVVQLFSPELALTASITGRSLRGDAADSPITRSTTNLEGLVSLTYAF